MNTLLLVGGGLCERAAGMLDPAHWRCLGLRRRPGPAPDGVIAWHEADLRDPESLSFLCAPECPAITHILYAPAPDARTPADYAEVYPAGLSRLLGSLPSGGPGRLRRCVLVGSSAVWGPADGWVDEETPPDATDFRARALLDAEAALHALLPPGVGITLRLSGLYGPGRRRLVDGLRAGSIPAPDGPGHWANRLHIDDAARACAHLLSLDRPEPLYIGTDGHPLPTAVLYDALARLAGGPVPARQARAPSGKRLSNARLRASGWTPAWPDALAGYRACLAQDARAASIDGACGE
uniref:NAD-dependent epimerase/dehydratase family protein n=1 Tax=Castellaniella defragrans TaxID=75697 RepID=UPI0033409931